MDMVDFFDDLIDSMYRAPRVVDPHGLARHHAEHDRRADRSDRFSVRNRKYRLPKYRLSRSKLRRFWLRAGLRGHKSVRSS